MITTKAKKRKRALIYIKTLEITTPFHKKALEAKIVTTPFYKQKVRKSQSTKKTPQKTPKAYMHTHIYTYTQRHIKLCMQRERYIHAYTTQETHKIHKHIQKHTQRDKEKQSKKTQETRNTQKPI